jgi:hypothetical protein
LNLTSAIGNLANRNILASYISRHNAMAYDENHAEKNLYKEKINPHNLGGHERCKDSITIKKYKVL